MHERWGFGDKLAGGKGLCVLFAGPPGTGKTTAAGMLAAALGLDLYWIDLSAAVSKYVGETEKNLRPGLRGRAGQQRGPALRRGRRAVRAAHQIRHAHDRYANVEVS